MSIKSWTSKRSCEFRAAFCWEVAKFVASEVRVLQCSWFGNITTNEFKQSENISQPSKAYFMMFTSESLKGKLFEVQRDSTSQTDGATWIWFTVVMQTQKFNNTTVKYFVFFVQFLEWRMCCKKVFFISDIFKYKVLLNHYVWKFYLKLPEKKPKGQKL